MATDKKKIGKKNSIGACKKYKGSDINIVTDHLFYLFEIRQVPKLREYDARWDS